MTLREAAEMALEFCENIAYGSPWEGLAPLAVRKAAMKSMDALRAALAEPDEIAAEREACARVCEQYAEHQQQWRNESAEFRAMGANEAAEAIRARGAYET